VFQRTVLPPISALEDHHEHIHYPKNLISVMRTSFAFSVVLAFFSLGIKVICIMLDDIVAWPRFIGCS
jgi:hypothetical protein